MALSNPAVTQGAGYGGTSASTVPVALGDQSFITQAGLAYKVGARMRGTAVSDGTGATFVEGLLKSYSGTAMVITIDKIGANGGSSYSNWNFNIAGQPGAAAVSGISGAVGANDNRLTRTDGTGGSTIQGSGIALSDADGLSGVAGLDLASGTITNVPTPTNNTDAANKAYVDSIADALDIMQLKTVIDCSANPNWPAANKGWSYPVSVAGKIGGASGQNVEKGDFLVCFVDSSASGNDATVGANWIILQLNLAGTVAGLAMFNAVSATAQTALLDAATNSLKGLVKVSTAASAATGTATDEALRVADAAAVYAPVKRNTRTISGTTDTLVLADAGRLIYSSNGGATTITVPPNSSVAFPIDTQIDFIQSGAGKATLAQGSGVTINSVSSNKALGAQYAGASLVKTGTDTWILAGNLIA